MSTTTFVLIVTLAGPGSVSQYCVWMSMIMTLIMAVMWCINSCWLYMAYTQCHCLMSTTQLHTQHSGFRLHCHHCTSHRGTWQPWCSHQHCTSHRGAVSNNSAACAVSHHPSFWVCTVDSHHSWHCTSRPVYCILL